MKKISAINFPILLISFLPLLDSCHKGENNCGDPPGSFIQIILVDKNDSLLVGRKFDPDSVNLSVNNKLIMLSIYRGIITFNYNLGEQYNKDNYLLFLSKFDTDTINLTVNHYYNGNCWDYYKFNNFKYNFVNIASVPYNDHCFKIIKE